MDIEATKLLRTLIVDFINDNKQVLKSKDRMICLNLIMIIDNIIKNNIKEKE